MKLSKEQKEAVAELKRAKEVAKEVFGTSSPTPEMVFGCAGVDGEEVDMLKESIAIAREIFGNANPTPEMVLGCYGFVFEEDDDEDEDE